MPYTLENLMEILGISECEAKEVMKHDKRIDRGEKLNELPKELEAGAKKARQADRKRPATVKREHKTDENKLFLISVLSDTLKLHDAEILETVNPEREFLFMYNGKKYKLTLSCPRS